MELGYVAGTFFENKVHSRLTGQTDRAARCHLSGFLKFNLELSRFCIQGCCELVMGIPTQTSGLRGGGPPQGLGFL